MALTTVSTSFIFFMGLAYGLLDVLNKHFQETLHIDKARSSFLQMAYFGAYFYSFCRWFLQKNYPGNEKEMFEKLSKTQPNWKNGKT
jgi:fucose permease